jgi:hypothetical protein
MARPGVVVTSRADVPPRSAPTDAGMAFMVGATEKGSVDQVRSMTDYENTFGKRAGFTDTYDSADAFFREGGAALVVSPATEVDDGLGALVRALGPGQVFVPGAMGTAAHDELMQHAADNNRIALLDQDPASMTATALEATAALLSVSPNARYAALFAPAAVIPGVTSADTRTVPYSAVEAGIMARNASRFSPNVPAAGVNGISRFAIDLTATYTDAERETLNEAGVDIARVIYGQVETYGYRTLAPLDTGWGNLGNARLNMEIVAKAEAIGERYVFSQIDGRRVKISQFGAELSAMLIPYWEAGSLYGDTAQDAFFVDVGPGINTETTIANGELHAVIGVRMSPFAEYVVIEIVKVATDQPLALAA